MAVNELTESELQTAIGSDLDTAKRLLPVAKSLVNQYANSAPQEVKNEAMIRISAWLHEQPAAITQTSISGAEITYRGGNSPLRNSGAMSLLNPWRKRRAVAI